MEQTAFSEALARLSNEEIGLLIKPANGVEGIPFTAEEREELRSITSAHKKREEQSKGYSRELSAPSDPADVRRLRLLEDAIAANESAHTKDATRIRGIVVLACDRAHKLDPQATETFVAQWAPSFGNSALSI